MAKIYTGIGSRKAPIHILTLARLIGWKLASEGWTLYSGGAEGMDINFYLGALGWTQTQVNVIPNLATIFLPWDGFQKRHNNDPSGHFINYQLLECCPKALELAASVHPNWEAVKKGGSLHMHGRNACQILGLDLKTPTKNVICWAPETIKGVVSGGTATAVSIARASGIPVTNLFNIDDYNRALKFVELTDFDLKTLSGNVGASQ